MNVVYIYIYRDRNIRTEQGVWGSAKQRTMERKVLGLEKSDVPASLRISEYLWIRTDKVCRDLPKLSVEKVQVDTCVNCLEESERMRPICYSDQYAFF